MDARLQAKLLRAIQERVIDRVGSNRPVPVDIRILATSNRNLQDAVREGTFREDLLFRLNVVNLKLPPLRERPGDIAALSEHFVKKYAEANGLGQRALSADARAALLRAPWPGNVRELENTLHRAVVLATSETIGPEAIAMPDGTGLTDFVGAASVATQAAQMAETLSRTLVGRTVADVERDLILDTLDHVLGNRTHAANILGISIRTLRNKLNQYADEGVAVAGPGEQRSSAA
jgi:DNA-binding NtrC family response regulator